MKFSLAYTKGVYDLLDDVTAPMINDIYFSDGVFKSARVDIFDGDDWDELNKIREEYGIKLHLILNSNYYSNDLYKESEVNRLVDHVLSLNVDILTINNTFLMQDERFRSRLTGMTLKASVNNKIRTKESVDFFIDKLGYDEIILDRSLNRCYDELQEIVEYCKTKNVKTTILVNEGCIPNCSYKQFCDMKISQTPNGEVNSSEFSTGCYTDYNKYSEMVLQSPFILPTALSKYKFVDYIKIAGRYSSKEEMGQIIDAYMKNDGNVGIGILMNAYTPEKFNSVSSYLLEDHEFTKKVMNCRNECSTCDYCNRVMDVLDSTYIN
jgi:collagenase-like PrtC family protease